MRILITGSTGLLGQALHARLGAVHEVWGVSRRVRRLQWLTCDLTDRITVVNDVRRLRPQVIVHTAAQSDVDDCERHQETAWNDNVSATEYLLEAAQDCAAAMLYVSTDYVFDGLKGLPYTETDPPRPVNYYGQTKLAGEVAVQRASHHGLIVRVSTLFGPGRETFVDTVIRQAVAGRPVIVFDQTTSPTYAVDAAEGIARLLESRAEGLVHLVNAGAASRADVARVVLDQWHCPQAAVEVRRADTTLLAQRPPNSSLAMTRMQAVTGWSPQPWARALQQYLAWKKRSTLCNSAS